MNGKKLLAVLFAIVIVALPLMTAFSEKQAVSEWEGQELANFPSFSEDSVMNKSFMDGFDEYFSDHFVGRYSWLQAKAQLELMTMKKGNNSILLTDKGSLVEQLDEPNEKYVKANINGILKYAENHPDSKIYAAIAPTACDIYADTLPYGKTTWSQKKEIESFYSAVSSKVYGIDIYTPLVSKKDQYIYYNTDHHWTSLGAYYAYHQIATALDFKPYEKTQFDIEHASNEFYGTYSSTSNIMTTPDTIDLYTLASTDLKVTEVRVNTGKEETVYNDIYFREWLDKKDKYSVFLGKQRAEITVKTNVQNSKKLLIFKDSYAHSLIPFLSLHYSEIKLVDLRYVHDYKSLIGDEKFDNVLLLYNIESVVGDGLVAKLGE